MFRKDSLGATLLVVGIAGALGIEWLGLLEASTRGRTMEEILPHTRPWGIAIVATLGLVFAWTGAESLLYYQKLRRRLALGLGDPIVANRMLLWAVAGFATVLLCGVIAASMLAGMAPLQSALPLCAIGTSALVASICWTLAFFPPASYLAALLRRQAAVALAERRFSARHRGRSCRRPSRRAPAVSRPPSRSRTIAGSPLGYCFRRDS